jgi:DNA ligase-1
MSRFGTDDATGHTMTLAPFFFDVLHLDGEDLLDGPSPNGRRYCRARRRMACRDQTDDPETASVRRRARTGHEGVMVKAPTRYEAGRRGAGGARSSRRTLDLVVLAAEWGHGRRRGWLSNLHLGARDSGTGDFVMVGKTFKGLTDELLTWQTERLQGIATQRDDYTVYVRPELVVEIALDGVQVSTRYPGGVALRFARVRAYRPDKTAADADTIDALRALLAP